MNATKPPRDDQRDIVTFLFGYQASSFAIVRANHSMAEPAASGNDSDGGHHDHERQGARKKGVSAAM